jgi:hypothetical protein
MGSFLIVIKDVKAVNLVIHFQFNEEMLSAATFHVSTQLT